MAKVVRWQSSAPPTEREIRAVLAKEGLKPYAWGNGPGDVYGTHMHSYNKVIYVVQGSISFGLPDQGEDIALRQGDRLELPAGTRHDAVVGHEGVACLEAHY